MKPVIIDADSTDKIELWTAVDCAKYSDTARGTFTSYAGRGRAPKPVIKFHGLTLWNSEDVKKWTEERNKGNRGAMFA